MKKVSTSTTRKTTTSKASTSAKTPQPQQTAENEKFVVKKLPSTMEKVTVADFFDRDFLVPEFQRGYMWDEKQERELLDSINTGVPLPPVIMGRVKNDKGEDVDLLIDGVQRYNALKALQRGTASEVQENWILGADIYIMVVECGTVAIAAKLFVKYNNGRVLAAAQRNKAKLDPVKLEVLSSYTPALKRFGGTKVGKVTYDVLGVMLAAAALSMTNADYKDTAATTSAPCNKALERCPRFPCLDDMAGFKAALEAVANLDDKSLRATWAAPVRLVPLCMAAQRAKANAEAVSAVIKRFNVDDTRTALVCHKGKTSNVKVCDAFADRGNGAKPTSVRRDVMFAYFNGSLIDSKAHENEEAQKQTAEAMEAMVNGGD